MGNLTKHLISGFLATAQNVSGRVSAGIEDSIHQEEYHYTGEIVLKLDILNGIFVHIIISNF